MTKTVNSGRVSLVLSGVALLIALSGTAYAANTVRSVDIVDGAVKGVDIRNGTVTTADVAASSFGRSPRLWAQIGNGGNLIRGAGGTTAAAVGTGQYTVTFSRDVSHCAVSATPFATTPVMAAYQVGTSTVTVNLFDDTGVAVTAAFDIIVVC